VIGRENEGGVSCLCTESVLLSRVFSLKWAQHANGRRIWTGDGGWQGKVAVNDNARQQRDVEFSFRIF
jgi:hypothetical protein